MRRFLIVLVALLSVVQFASLLRAAEPDTPPEMQHVRYLVETIGSRPWGSANEGRAAGYIAGEFRALGLDTRIQSFQPIAGDPRMSQNVIATLPGEPGYGTIYIGAHYDSVSADPGAVDNASGVGVLLESARLFATSDISPTLTFIAFGAEEMGTRGSQYYVSRFTSDDLLSANAMINLDCVGYGDKLAILPAGDRAGPLQQIVASAAKDQGATPLNPDRGGGGSDHAPFGRAGIPAVWLHTWHDYHACGSFYHTAEDSIDKVEPATLEQTTRVVATSINLLAQNADVRHVEQTWLPFMSN